MLQSFHVLLLSAPNPTFMSVSFGIQTQGFAYVLIKHCIVQRSVMEIEVFMPVMKPQWEISIFHIGGK